MSDSLELQRKTRRDHRIALMCRHASVGSAGWSIGAFLWGTQGSLLFGLISFVMAMSLRIVARESKWRHEARLRDLERNQALDGLDWEFSALIPDDALEQAFRQLEADLTKRADAEQKLLREQERVALQKVCEHDYVRLEEVGMGVYAKLCRHCGHEGPVVPYRDICGHVSARPRLSADGMMRCVCTDCQTVLTSTPFRLKAAF